MRYAVRVLILFFFTFLFELVFSQGKTAIQYVLKADSAFITGSYREAVSLYSKVFLLDGVLDPTKFHSSIRLAECYKFLGEYKLAMSQYEKSYQYCNNIEDFDICLINNSELFCMVGQFDDAENLLNQIEGWAESENLPGERRQLAQNRENYIFLMRDIHKANIMLRKHDLSRAEQLLISIKEYSSEKNSHIILQNLGYVQIEMKKYQDSYDNLLKATSLMDSLSLNNTTSYYESLGNLAIAEALLASNKPDSAKYYSSAINHIDRVVKWFDPQTAGSINNDYIIALRKKAEILLLMGNKKEAEKTFRLYFTIERNHVLSVFFDMTEQNRLDFWKKEKPLISEIFRLGETCPDFLLDIALFRRELSLLGGKKANTEDSILLRNKVESRLRLTGKEIRKMLRPDEVAIDFIRYEEHYAALLIPSLSSNKPVRFIHLFNEKELNGFKIGDRRLDVAVKSKNNDKDDKNGIYYNKELAEKIWNPILKSGLISNAGTIYFAPDGMFHMLGIEYLYELVKGSKHVNLHRLTSLSNLADRSSTTNKFDSEKFLAVGNLNYNSLEGYHIVDSIFNHDAYDYLKQFNNGVSKLFRRLRASKEEIEGIHRVYDNAQYSYVASEDVIKESLYNKLYNNIHLATHGYALRISFADTPYILRDSLTEDRSLLASGIALTGANVANTSPYMNDGIISARELCDIDMSNVDFIIVSACQAAQGETSDEGPAGLVRGLKKAGVKSIMASLWEVDDDATSFFMQLFYEELKSRPKFEAFETARKKLQLYERPKRPKMNNGKKIEEIVRDSNGKIEMEKPFNYPYYYNSFILIDIL